MIHKFSSPMHPCQHYKPPTCTLVATSMIHPKLGNINLHHITHSIISRNPRKRMFVVQISLLIVTFLSLISQNLSLMQTTKQVNPHTHSAPCVDMWSVNFLFFFFFLLCHLFECWCMHMPHRPGRPSGVDHTNGGERRKNEFKFHSAICYTISIVSLIHVNTTKLRIITCNVVATSVILWSLDCIKEL